MRHTVDIINREKKNKAAPVITAPAILVAAKVIARRTIEPKTVPSIPARIEVILVHIQLFEATLPNILITLKIKTRKRTAIPKITHKKAGVTVITAVKRRNAVIIPITKLKTSEKNVQLFPQPQYILFILFHLQCHYM